MILVQVNRVAAALADSTRFSSKEYKKGQVPANTLSLNDRQKVFSMLYEDRSLQVAIRSVALNFKLRGQTVDDIKDFAWEVIAERILSDDSGFPIDTGLLASPPKYSSTYKGYLVSTARNAILSSIRKNTNSKSDVLPTSISLTTEDRSSCLVDKRCLDVKVDCRAADALVCEIKDAMNEIPENRLAVFRRMAAHGYSPQVMSDATGEGRSSLQGHKSRVINQLKAHFGDREDVTNETLAYIAKSVF